MSKADSVEYRLIAVMLGRLRMSIQECISAYLELSNKVFQPYKSAMYGFASSALTQRDIEGRFNSEALETALKTTLKAQDQSEDALFKDNPNTTCKV